MAGAQAALLRLQRRAVPRHVRAQSASQEAEGYGDDLEAGGGALVDREEDSDAGPPYEEEAEEAEDDMLVWKDYMELNIEGPPRMGAGAIAAPAITEAGPGSSGGGAAAAAAAEAAVALSLLPGIGGATHRRSRFFGPDTLPLRPQLGDQSQWDLRAAAERKARQEREHAAWQADREATIGRHASVGADWRTDVRILDTGNPTQPDYHEWTLREIWDMIALGGAATDPREVPHRVHRPGARTDFLAEGYQHQPEVPEWLAERGKLIEDADVDEVADRDAEVALLASEFSDFDDFGAAGGADAAADADEFGPSEM